MTPSVLVVTGASGFVGASVLRRLKARGDRVIALSRTNAPNDSLGGQWIQCCLTQLTANHWKSAGIRHIDCLLHIAAHTPKAAADRDAAHEMIRSNILGTQALLDSLPAVPRRVVFCSTLDVYADVAFRTSVDETSPTGPAGLYGASKLFGEALIRTYAEHTSAEYVVLRLAHLYGPGEERYRKLIPETIRRILADQPPRLYGDGSERRDFLYIDDAAEAIVRATTATLRDGPIINIASGQSTAVRDIVDLIVQATQYRGDIERREGVPTLSTEFNVSVMHSTLGSWPLVPLGEGLRREVCWLKERR